MVVRQYGYCLDDQVPSIVLPTDNMEAWSGKQIAPLSNLAERQIYMEVGNLDAVVGANVMAQLAAQLSNFYSSSRATFHTTIGAAHTFPTDFDGSGDSACDLSESPFVSNCGYDGAGAVLQWMYGSLAARNDGTLGGQVLSFAQTGEFGAAGLDKTGYLYVPAACAGGATQCKLHVVLHGCGQSHDLIGSTFIDSTGYNMWAGKKTRRGEKMSEKLANSHIDTNNIIVLYPQAVVDESFYIIWDDVALDNPNACFDWLGWYGNNADQIGGKFLTLSLYGCDLLRLETDGNSLIVAGVQMVAIVNMVNQILSG